MRNNFRARERVSGGTTDTDSTVEGRMLSQESLGVAACRDRSPMPRLIGCAGSAEQRTNGRGKTPQQTPPQGRTSPF
ncbi:hypothetical protein CDAR_603531 [Caerostris darwini]|uniref:Uncharacterized protein n=1 Tax=Caerostris darwini TaxID=1538125 RepID=A0AAV4T6R7_9ARAC|nr:hypothetical protein CDAR_603531 [Caerostris darwini]